MRQAGLKELLESKELAALKDKPQEEVEVSESLRAMALGAANSDAAAGRRPVAPCHV